MRMVPAVLHHYVILQHEVKRIRKMLDGFHQILNSKYDGKLRNNYNGRSQKAKQSSYIYKHLFVSIRFTGFFLNKQNP